MEEKLLNVSSSPHVRDHSSTKSIMRDVVIALLPATIVGIYNFRLSAVLVILTCCVSCVLSEYIWQRLMKQKVTTYDFSALLTGLLLGLNLPATMGSPKYLWMCILGSVFAIIVVKQLFGGLGQNFMNPALGGRCFLMLSFSSIMTSFTVEKGANWLYGISVDATSAATPLMQVKQGELPKLTDMFLGTTTGSIGETSVAALLLGAVYLLVRHVIDWKIPVIYIASFAVFDVILMIATGDATYPLLFELCGGGLILGAFFMATDYVTSPITSKGKIIYAVLLGLLTGLFRFFGEAAEGVSFAIIIGNLFVPLIERYTVPRAFGKGGRRIGNHEDRIKSQTKMSDNLLIICLVLIFFQKICRSGKGNLIDILFHFFCRHSQTIIGKGNRLFLRIDFHIDSCLVVVRKRGFTHKFQFLQFGNGIAPITHYLANKNIMVGIQPFFNNGKYIFRINRQISLLICHINQPPIANFISSIRYYNATKRHCQEKFSTQLI